MSDTLDVQRIEQLAPPRKFLGLRKDATIRVNTSAAPYQSRPYIRFKRCLDVVLACLILLLSSPVVLAAMILVRVTSRGPVIYKQVRLGEHGTLFTIYKIRTMAHQCEAVTGARWSLPGDSRVTPVGRILRALHIDELPQMWNILRGEMSLIGPRPERPEFLPHLVNAVAFYQRRLLVKPGLTGLAQVQLPPDTNLDSVRKKITYDLYYVQYCSLRLDIAILFGTALKLMHAPFEVIRVLCAIPRSEEVYEEYEQLLKSEAIESEKQIQSA